MNPIFWSVVILFGAGVLIFVLHLQARKKEVIRLAKAQALLDTQARDLARAQRLRNQYQSAEARPAAGRSPATKPAARPSRSHSSKVNASEPAYPQTGDMFPPLSTSDHSPLPDPEPVTMRGGGGSFGGGGASGGWESSSSNDCSSSSSNSDSSSSDSSSSCSSSSD